MFAPPNNAEKSPLTPRKTIRFFLNTSMSTESFVQVPPNSSGPEIRTEQVVTAAGTVQEQVIVIGDPNNPAALATVDPSTNTLNVNADAQLRTTNLLLLQVLKQLQALANAHGQYLPLEVPESLIGV